MELWKLGITATTQHNEVAPAQHELAPIYSTANVAVDQNQLTMETMKRVAIKHGLVCLLHEKPYAGINGSGKHNNWSVGTDEGENLFEPGDDPIHNLQFLLVLSCVLAAVDNHADLLRESASDVGNEHRLGAQEAPPAIISIFLGNQLDEVVNQVIKGEDQTSAAGGELDTGVSTVPVLHKDATDRNRTSPFAFTGNKFEFRMVGSADSIASPNTALNAALAEAFCAAADALEGADVPVLVQDDVVAMYEKFNIFTKAELVSRVEIQYENYAKRINIEANAMIHMASKAYIPAVVAYTGDLANTVAALEAIDADATTQKALLAKVNKLLKEAAAALADLERRLAEVNTIESLEGLARFFHDTIVPSMAALRAPIDKLELLVDQDVWPMYSYGDLLFEV